MSPAGTARRLLAGTILALATLTALAAPAHAHAEVVSASPAPGDGLAQAPGAVVLKFSERLEARLSRIDVLDRNDRTVATGATQLVRGDPSALRRPLGLLRPGRYRVRWITVSAVDGHTLSGSYTFGVGTATSGNEEVAAGPLDSEGGLGFAGRLVAFVGLSLWFGALALAGVARRAGLAPRRLAVLARLGPILAGVGTAVAVASATRIATGSLDALDDVLLDTGPGRWRLAVLALAGLGTLPLLHRFGDARWRKASLVLAVGAIVADAASGHPAATASPLAATMSLAIHLLAVGIWLFALTAALLSAASLRRALAAFAPAAIVAAIAVATTGLVNTVLEVSDVAQLTSTGYGKVVLVKAIVLAGMVVLGLMHATARRLPAIDLSLLRLVVRTELGGGALALILAALLVAYPNPPREQAAAGEIADPVALRGVTRGDALSIGDASGPFIIGLTLHPPRPGRVRITAQIIGVEPGDALRDAHIRATRGTEELDIALRDCGFGCLRGQARFTRGQWRLDTEITTNRGTITTSAVVPIPAPAGRHALDRVIAAMQDLESLRVSEELRGTATADPIITDYQYQAPDAFAYAIRDGYANITIGRLDFDREHPSDPWEAYAPSASEDAFRWPADFYREFWEPASAVRILGAETLDGTTTTVLAFVRADVGAWFRLWIDDNAIVRRMEMRAEGHIMNQRYSDFDTPITIEPPT